MIATSYFRAVLSVFAAVLLSGPVAFAAGTESEIPVGTFGKGILSGWKVETVWNSRKTSYSLVKDNGKTVLMGKSVNAASALIHKISLDPKLYPIVRWSWKIDHTISKANERTKAGHDFAARIYVVFPRGLFTYRAIEYVWGNVMAKGEVLRSPYSNQAVMIAVDSGDEMAGKWMTHQRNYFEDYRTAFGEDPPKLGAIALMTDSDNTGETAVGYFGDIDLLSGGKTEEHQKEPLREVPVKQLNSVPESVPVKDRSVREPALIQE